MPIIVNLLRFMKNILKIEFLKVSFKLSGRDLVGQLLCQKYILRKIKNTIVASEVRFGLLPDKTVIEPKYHSINGISKNFINKLVNNVLESDYVFNDYISLIESRQMKKSQETNKE